MKSLLSKYKSWPTWVKWTSIIMSSLVLLLIIGWFALSWYVNYKKQSFIDNITTYFHENMSGTLTIKNLEPSIVKTFPKLSIRLDDVVIYDSLYEEHQVKTLDLERIYAQINFFSLLTQRPKIKRIILKNGSIHLFHDENDYSNTYLFKSKDEGKKEKSTPKDLDINLISLENIHFTFIDIPKKKEHDLIINKLHAKVKPTRDKWFIKADLNAYVHQLGFNLRKGVYLHEKNVKSKFAAIYDKKQDKIFIENQKIMVEKDPIIIDMIFHIDKDPVEYDFHFKSDGIQFKDGMSIVTEHVSSKFTTLDIESPAAADVYVSGRFQYLDTPSVTVKIRLDDNTLITPVGDLKHTNIKAVYINHVNPDLPRIDYNSGIYVEAFEGIFEGIPIQGDSTTIFGLRNPLIKTRIHSTFPVQQLNNLTGKTIQFDHGEASFDFAYQGPLIATDTFNRTLDGYLKVKDAGITYKPNGLHFKQGNIDMSFEGEDVKINQIALSSEQSKVNITGYGKRFLNAYFLDPSQVIIETFVKSNSIDLYEFKSILNPQHKQISNKPSTQRSDQFNEQLALVLDKSTFKAHLDIGKVKYNKFTANNIKGRGSFEENKIDLEQFQLQHAGGSINITAQLKTNNPNSLPVNMNADIQNVHVDELFYAFNEFGLKVLTSKNLKGKFTALANLNFQFDDDFNFKENTINGTLDFKLRDGALNDFEPLVNLSKFIFKRRNLENITFKEINNKLSISNGMIQIPSFEISSSAIRLTLDGVYGLREGTDINIAVPLRNPQKDINREKRGRKPRGEGIIIHLNAKEDENGAIKLKWAPGHKDDDSPEKKLDKHKNLEFDSDD